MRGMPVKKAIQDNMASAMLGKRISSVQYDDGRFINNDEHGFETRISGLSLIFEDKSRFHISPDKDDFPFGIKITKRELFCEDKLHPMTGCWRAVLGKRISSSMLYWRAEERLNVIHQEGKVFIPEGDQTVWFSFPEDLSLEFEGGDRVFIRPAVLHGLQTGLSSSNDSLTIVFNDNVARIPKMGNFNLPESN